MGNIFEEAFNRWLDQPGNLEKSQREYVAYVRKFVNSDAFTFSEVIPCWWEWAFEKHREERHQLTNPNVP